MTTVKEFYRKEFNEMTNLQKENIKLKEEVKYYKQIAQHHGDMSVKYPAKCVVYKQALQEIKEIAKFHTTQADSEDVQEDMKQILQKISEVLDAR